MMLLTTNCRTSSCNVCAYFKHYICID